MTFDEFVAVTKAVREYAPEKIELPGVKTGPASGPGKRDEIILYLYRGQETARVILETETEEIGSRDFRELREVARSVVIEITRTERKPIKIKGGDLLEIVVPKEEPPAEQPRDEDVPPVDPPIDEVPEAPKDEDKKDKGPK